ncbi:MAG: 2-oxoacid:ferredoxin oxidoreductase subunit beta, partial [Pseudomonadota bacterium]
TFANNVGSTKSYAATRDNLEAMPVDFVPMREEIRTQYKEGSSQTVTLHDGSIIHLHKASKDYKADSREDALMALQAADRTGKVLTGLLYLDPTSQDLNHTLELASQPLNSMGKDELCPGSRVLKSINEGLR